MRSDERQTVSLLATGDLIIDEPEPDSYFDLARAVLRGAELVVGHVEVPFTLQREGRRIFRSRRGTRGSSGR